MFAKIQAIASCERVAERATVRCDEARLNEILKAVLMGNGRVMSLQRTRYSLETLFLDTLKTSDTRSIGSEIS